ncbi:MAG: hypothetical protein ACYSYL_21905 [Planctomycetota bacterium]
MSEEEARAKGQRPRIAKLSVLSLTLSVVGLFLGTIGAYVIGRFHNALILTRGPLTWIRIIPYIVFSTAWSISVLSLIIGSIGLKKIKKSNGLLSGHKFVHTGIIIAMITIWWVCLMIYVGRIISTSFTLYKTR